MADLRPETPLIELKGVGPARSRQLADAGMQNLLDLLFRVPSRYEDRRQEYPLDEIREPGRFLVRGRLQNLKRVRIRRRGLTLVRGFVEDGSERLPVLWFNRPYLINQVEEGEEYSLYGEVRWKGNQRELVNPTCERAERNEWTGCIVPIYPTVEGLGGTVLRSWIQQALERCDVPGIPEPLPQQLLQRYQLPQLGAALMEIHRPPDDADLAALNTGTTRAHARLSYGEFLELQAELRLLRGLERQQVKEHRYELNERVRAILLDLLPFRLTEAQRRVLKEISEDLTTPYPMLRLLQGDVGSGKTIVAALALVMALESGLQGAFMAPTELLAEQHFRTFTDLLQGRYRIALLTRSVENSRRIKADVASGEVQLVIGTHSLIQRDLDFRQLGLAVVDEQHRFGVSQRRVLQQKGGQPDLLVMTATPIPRSLALTVYGDLSLSIIDELPPGRQPIDTQVVQARGRPRLYRWLKEEIEGGSQAYIVFPLIEESEALAAESIDLMGSWLRKYLAGIESAVLHGRVAVAEREEIMDRFRRGELKVLIATTVIEVGVDVPNASLMVIESGERFGLSQLHQLRGRVGRGRRHSKCVVVHGALSEDARRRLQVFGATTDGFRIAEADLEIRGPGDLLGTRQSGVPWFRIADIIRDREWLERARRDADDLVGVWGQSGVEDAFESRIRKRAQQRFRAFGGG